MAETRPMLTLSHRVGCCWRRCWIQMHSVAGVQLSFPGHCPAPAHSLYPQSHW
jgi:hypothetical protein